jgi:hypothetical protein
LPSIQYPDRCGPGEFVAMAGPGGGDVWGAEAGGWVGGVEPGEVLGAWAGSKMTRTRLFLLSAIHRFPALSMSRSWMLLN